MPRPKKPQTQGGYAPGQNPGGAPAQAPKAPTGLPYGQHQQLVDAQRQVPLPGPTPQPPPAAGPGSGAPMMDAAQAALGLRPPPAGGLLRGTDRPDEPVTAGLPTGPGPGPEVLGGMHETDQVLANLYKVYQENPTEGLRALIEETERARNGRA